MTRLPRHPAVLLQTLIAVLTLALAAPAVPAPDLQADVEELVRRTPITGGRIAVSIWDADSQIPLVSIEADTPMVPASNLKLLISGAALQVLGPEHEFRTTLERDGARLIVRGDGDPAFGDPELLAIMADGEDVGIDVPTLLSYWVDAVRSAGLNQVSELVVDDRIFDRQFVHRDWPAEQLNRDYCAEVAGLNFHLNVVHFYPRPSAGARPLVGTYAPRYPDIDVFNRATSRTGPGETSTAWIARPAGTNDLTLRGNVRSAYRVPIEVTIHDPPLLFAGLLAAELRRAGVVVAEARVAAADETLSGERIGPVITTPLGTVLTRCNRDSTNVYAEALLKRLGHEVTGQPGSWLNGAAALRHVVHQRLGDPRFTERLTVRDGSGLSRLNTVTAATLAAWLTSFHNDERLGPIFIESLATAGEDGTLRRRFRNADLGEVTVQAKTGYIDFVSCLSGYVTGPDGARRAFSIMGNDLKRGGSISRTKRLQERIVRAIAEDMTRQGVTMGGD